MITYLTIKNAINRSYDIEELIMNMIFILPSLLIDFGFIFLQPIFYITYYFWKKRK